jgi:hypothetical protein
MQYTACMIDVALVILGAIFAACLSVIEAYCIWTGQPTISHRLQEWARRNVQIAVFLGVVVGWLVAHFTGMPG